MIDIGNRIARSGIDRIVPGRIRSIGKRLLGKLQLYDERPARVGLARIYSDDTFIVSYPRSGNTWVRFLLASLRNPDLTISFRNIEEYVPDLHKSRQYANFMTRPRFMKSHRPRFECFPRFIYVYRDVRDVMVSYYHYSVQRGSFRRTFSEFLRSPVPERFGSWWDHVRRATMFARQYPERVLLLRYEEMVLSAIEFTGRIAAFCGILVDEEMLEEAVRRSSFTSLQENERRFGSAVEEVRGLHFFRAGRIGAWRSVFSDADLQYVYSRGGGDLADLGYEL